MAVNLGKDGYVTIDDKNILHINNWELTIPKDALETTVFGSTTPWDRTFVPGLRSPTATFSGYYEDTSTGQYSIVQLLMSTATPSTVDAQLLYYHPTTGTYAGYAGTAVMTGITLGAPVEGIQPISANLQFSGGVHTTAAAT